jgi:hypothetical protein
MQASISTRTLSPTGRLYTAGVVELGELWRKKERNVKAITG